MAAGDEMGAAKDNSAFSGEDRFSRHPTCVEEVALPRVSPFSSSSSTSSSTSPSASPSFLHGLQSDRPRSTALITFRPSRYSIALIDGVCWINHKITRSFQQPSLCIIDSDDRFQAKLFIKW